MGAILSTRSQAFLVFYYCYLFESQRKFNIAERLRHQNHYYPKLAGRRCTLAGGEIAPPPPTTPWRWWQSSRSDRGVGCSPKQPTAQPFESTSNNVAPELHWLLNALQWFSFGCHLINIVLVGGISLNLIDRVGTIRCHYMPIFAIHSSVPQELMMWCGCVFSVSVVCWQIIMRFYGPSFKFDAIAFLISNPFQCNISRGESAAGGGVWRPNSITRAQLNTSSSQDGANLDYIESILYYEHSTIRQAATIGSIRYLIRPNRTAKAYQTLARVLEKSLTVVMLTGGLCFGILVPIGTKSIWCNHAYLYPGCDLRPKETYWNQIFDVNYLWRSSTSAVISMLLLLDCIGGLWFAATLTTVLAYDLFICWDHIRMKVEKLYKLMVTMAHLRLSLQASTSIDGGDSDGDGQADKTSSKWSIFASERDVIAVDGDDETAIYQITKSPISYRSERAIQKRWFLFEKQVEAEYVSLRAIFMDFIAQLRSVNCFISKVIAMTIFIWLLINLTVIALGGLRLPDKSGMFVVRPFQFLTLIYFTTISMYVVRLQSSTLPAYKLLCSIAALDQSDEKERWIPLLIYYTGREKPYGFSVSLSGALYTKLYFVKVISYTLTLMFLFESYRNLEFKKS